jgi:hypothetical protein
MPDLRPLFTESTAARTYPGLQMTRVTTPCRLRLDADTQRLLREGLGRFDMEIRWLAHLDAAGVLRLWRSWTGLQIYRAMAREGADGEAGIERLEVEQHPDRYRGRLTDEPRQFEVVLVAVINTLREFRAGYTPYGPVEGAEPRPRRWPG